MKVYVITKGEYSDYHICCVCLDRETAEIRARLFADKNYYTGEMIDAEIEEYETDDYEEFVKVGYQIRRRDGKRLYEVYMDEYKDGDKMIQRTRVKEREISEYNMNETCWPSKDLYMTECGVIAPGTRWELTVYAREEKEALKIAYDRIAKMKWEMLEEAAAKGEEKDG